MSDEEEKETSESEVPNDQADVSDPEDSNSLNSSYRIEPSGTMGLEEAFNPLVSSSPARNPGSDSEDDDLGNRSLDSVRSMFSKEVDLAARQEKVQSTGKSKACPSSGPSIDEQIAEALRQAGVRTASLTQDLPLSSTPAAVFEDAPAIPADLDAWFHFILPPRLSLRTRSTGE